MNNNDIFKKLRVALMLRDDQIEEILKLVDFRMSKGEIGNFFRNADHPKFVECGDQVLRNFLNGLVIYLRGTKENPKNPMDVIAIHKKEAQPKEFREKKIENREKTATTTAPKKKFVPKKQVKKEPIVEKVQFKNGKNKK
ncbi:DUF1456 family protein [Flavobacterium sp.]|uniref:DUF1456 family protein n=1 Tax=Flavobacterium sp. TaxID=239 RepID=UPI002B4B09EC|nr:DUF1456 family protein [Flavobacterium sp.]HLP65422.1 DUF1456 family protein [Flavobacterium sp.]